MYIVRYNLGMNLNESHLIEIQTRMYNLSIYNCLLSESSLFNFGFVSLSLNA